MWIIFSFYEDDSLFFGFEMLTNNIVNGMFDNLKKENPSKDHTDHDSPTYYNELVSLKVETTDKKVMLGTNTLAYAFDPTG
ncbi:hypothetical protein, partial [Massilicoli timonensis]|uniref:hypothetical protein n=1 Tax=Massilicoli timonensis TaxID=2015901 RepID=UPI0023F26A39